MKRVLAFCAVFLLGFVVATACFVVRDVLRDVRRGFESWGKPEILSDRTARDRLAMMGISVPASATDLYFFIAGFQDHDAFISMTLPPEADWGVVAQITGEPELLFAAEKIVDMNGPESYGPQYATEQWKLVPTLEAQVARTEDKSRDHGRIVLFYPDIGRLMIHDWSY